MKYDFIIVGAGLAGATCARLLTDKGYKCLIIEERPFVAGNCATDRQYNIDIHVMGSHVFYTNDDDVWMFINDKANWLPYYHKVNLYNNGKLYHLPFDLNLLYDVYGKSFPHEVKPLHEQDKQEFDKITNLKEFALSKLGKKIYEEVVKDFSTKLWGKTPEELPYNLISNIPLNFDSFNYNYYNAKYQGIPEEGYTQMVENIIGDDIPIMLNTNFLLNKDKYIKLANNIIYTGELDRFFNYCIGELSWRSINFIIKDESNHTSSLIGTPVLNFADTKLNWHRIIEHKWFTPERLNDEVFKNHTIVTYECGEKWEQGKEAFYPILTNQSINLYKRYYDKLRSNYPNVFLCGRKAEYKLYNMSDTIKSAMELCDNWEFKK